MANWMVYWRFETYMTSVIQGGKIDHTASQQYKRIAAGDIIWIVTLSGPKGLILHGRQEADRITDQKTAERLLKEDLWESDYHVITKKPTPKVRISFTAKEIARFRFDGLSKTLPPDFNGCHLQTMRKLSAETADLLEAVWRQRKARDSFPAFRKAVLKALRG